MEGQTENNTISIKVALVGESGVGKTSIINRYVSNLYRSNFIPSMSASYSNKTIEIKDFKKFIKFEIWDTLGQEKFRSMNRIFYKDVTSAILVFDITRNESFEQIKSYWLPEIRDKIKCKDLTIALCANKSDLYDFQEVSEKYTREFADENELIYFETSAKNGDGIDVS